MSATNLGAILLAFVAGVAGLLYLRWVDAELDLARREAEELRRELARVLHDLEAVRRFYARTGGGL